AAAWQDLVWANKGQRRRGIADISFHQFQPAHAAVSTAALILHIVPCAFQTLEQCFPGQQMKALVPGDDHAHSSKSFRSSAETSASIWPTRYELSSTSWGATCTVSEASHVF